MAKKQKIKIKDLGRGNKSLESFFLDDVLDAVKYRKKMTKKKKEKKLDVE